MKRNSGTLAAVAIAVALAAWAGVFAYGSWISAQKEVLSSQAKDQQDVSERGNADIRTVALARATKDLRAQLDDLARSDVISIADTIESIGKIAGLKLTIGSAIPEPAEKKKKSATATSTLRAIGFVVEADGTFAAVMHAAELLETVPLISSIQSLEFERAPISLDSGPSKSLPWHLVAHVRVLTSADISS